MVSKVIVSLLALIVGFGSAAGSHAADSEMRTWTDSTGQYRVRAAFVELKDDRVLDFSAFDLVPSRALGLIFRLGAGNYFLFWIPSRTDDLDILILQQFKDTPVGQAVFVLSRADNAILRLDGGQNLLVSPRSAPVMGDFQVLRL